MATVTPIPANSIVQETRVGGRFGRMKRRHGFTAGGKRDPQYRVWSQMLGRCHNPNDSAFDHYGARGITVCDRWRFGENDVSGFVYFIADMGRRPSPKHSIDRIDNNGPYAPDNCRWATKIEQIRNRTNTRMVTYQGVRMPLKAACELAGLAYYAVIQRFGYGWSEELALTEPVRKVPSRRRPKP